MIELFNTILAALHLEIFAEQVRVFFVTATFGRIAQWIAIALVVAVGTEYWAAFIHRTLWHRALMVFHRSHHRLHNKVFEANDIFAVLHAPVAIAIIVAGVLFGAGAIGDMFFGVGAGLTLFGFMYFVFHDGMVHGRLPVAFLRKVPMFSRWEQAHHEHHKSGAYPYGFFRGPTELAGHQVQAKEL